MEAPHKPKKKQNLATIGAMLILGGIIVLGSADDTATFYINVLREENGASWGTGLAWLLILGGASLLLTGLAKYFGRRG